MSRGALQKLRVFFEKNLLFLKKPLLYPGMKDFLSPALVVVFTAFALPISVIDLRRFRIPDKLSFPCFFLLLLLYCVLGREQLPNVLAAALTGLLLFYAIRLGSRGLGWGDVKYAAVIGLFCGVPGIFAAFFFAALSALAAVLVWPSRRGPRRQPIPFAPFLSAGALFARAFGNALTDFLLSRL
jgi:prepilin signal peptidase PulO-like enzyme (type II secretory pathway)